MEAAKGVLVILAGFGLLALLHHDTQHFAEAFVGRLHLNPASRYPQIFIQAAANLNDARIVALALMALAYAAIRLIEAYGLWHGRKWAEWFAVASGAIYLPAEIISLTRHITAVKLCALALNVIIIAYLAYRLLKERSGKSVIC